MPLNAKLLAETPNDAAPVSANGANHVVLMEDYQEARSDLKQGLKLKGYRVIDTDNGRDAARQARETHPDLLVVDMNLPLLYGLVAARQIVKHAQVGPIPVVIITHEDVVDPAAMIEVGATRIRHATFGLYITTASPGLLVAGIAANRGCVQEKAIPNIR